MNLEELIHYHQLRIDVLSVIVDVRPNHLNSYRMKAHKATLEHLHELSKLRKEVCDE